MTNKQLEQLTTLYKIFSPSKREQAMEAYIKTTLDALNIKYKQDVTGNIYNFVPNAPLLSAHMDQVQRGACTLVENILLQTKEGNEPALVGYNHKGDLSGLGADDKNGIFVILQTLEALQTYTDQFGFIFSVQEEIGGGTQALFERNSHILETIPYALVLDRKGAGDIIGAANSYCCKDMEKALTAISDKYHHGYSPCSGVFSDADDLSSYTPCVNLSVGYYRAHSNEEYTIIRDLDNALKFVHNILKDLPARTTKRFELAEKYQYPWGIDDNGYGYEFSGFDYDDYESPEHIKIEEGVMYLVSEYGDYEEYLGAVPKATDEGFTVLDYGGEEFMVYWEDGELVAWWLDGKGHPYEELPVLD